MHRKSGQKKLSKKTGHRKMWLAGLAGDLIKHGKIKTTRARGKEISCFLEKIITKAKKDTLASRRLVFSKTKNFPVTKKLFEITGKYQERKVRSQKPGARMKRVKAKSCLLFLSLYLLTTDSCILSSI
jgi:ribosomal protein L17